MLTHEKWVAFALVYLVRAAVQDFKSLVSIKESYFMQEQQPLAVAVAVEASVIVPA